MCFIFISPAAIKLISGKISFPDIPDLKKNRTIKINNKEKKLFFKNLYKIGYSRNFSKNLNETDHLKSITKAFQRRFRQELINGVIDKECLLISKNLAKN